MCCCCLLMTMLLMMSAVLLQQCCIALCTVEYVTGSILVYQASTQLVMLIRSPWWHRLIVPSVWLGHPISLLQPTLSIFATTHLKLYRIALVFLGGSDYWSHVGVITKVLSILLQERFLENVCVPRNHGYPRATLAIIDQRRQAIQRGDVVEYRRLAGPRKRSLRHGKQQWMEQVARTGENHLLCGEIKDAFASFRQLKQKCATSAPLKALDGKLLSDRASVGGRSTSALY